MKFFKKLWPLRKGGLRVDRNSESYKAIMAAAKDATPANGVNTSGMSNDEFIALAMGHKK